MACSGLDDLASVSHSLRPGESGRVPGRGVGAKDKRPAGVENSQGIITADYKTDTTDLIWQDAPEFKVWKASMDKYQPNANPAEVANVTGYAAAFLVVQVPKQCSNDLSRENVMCQAKTLHRLRVPMLMPGPQVNTSPKDHAPMKGVHFAGFAGDQWVMFGDLMSRDSD